LLAKRVAQFVMAHFAYRQQLAAGAE
jgi:hypothetical protein